MSPTLTRSGMLALASGAAFVFAGALTTAWPLVALGICQLCALLVLYTLFIPRAALIRRRQLELAWWVPAASSAGGALLAGRPLQLRLLMRNRTPYCLFAEGLNVLASSSISLGQVPAATRLRPGEEQTLQLQATPLAAGHWFFHGLFLRITDRFGVFTLQLYFPNLLKIRVFPPLGIGRSSIPFHPSTGTAHERAGLRLLRQRGAGSDLRELRDHIPGDPFKRIAWKATARTGKLMVREHESEILVTHWLLLDISSTMRASPAGRSKLDFGLELCAAFARLALEAGDRVGLITFDHRVFSRLEPADGRPQLFRLIDRLLELHSIVDEDLTDLTEPELYSVVARYLRFQEGLDVTLPGKPPPKGDPLWRHLTQGPRGELYNTSLVGEAVERLLPQRRASEAAWWWSRVKAADPWLARLRLFCRLSGLELPYRQLSELAGKEPGMAAALKHAAAARQSQFIVLISDLEALPHPTQLGEALKLCRHHRHSLTAIAPFGPDFQPTPAGAREQLLRDVLSLRAAREQQKIARLFATQGFPALSATPQDALHLLLRRLARLRLARRGAA